MTQEKKGQDETTLGEKFHIDFPVAFSYDPNLNVLTRSIEAHRLPSPCTRLDGFYLNVIPGSSETEVFLTVMPADPLKPVSRLVKCLGTSVAVEKTIALSI